MMPRIAVVYSRTPRKKQEYEAKSICTLYAAGHSVQCLSDSGQSSRDKSNSGFRHYRYCRTVSVSRFLYHQRLHCRGVGLPQGAPDYLERLRHELLCGDVGTDCRGTACRSLLGRGAPFQLRVRHGAAHCCRQPDGISGRFVSERLRHEPHESGKWWTAFLCPCHLVHCSGGDGRLSNILSCCFRRNYCLA